MSGYEVRMTAGRVFDVKDAATEDAHIVFRCDTCKALVLTEDVQDHFAWHGTLLHYRPEPTQ